MEGKVADLTFSRMPGCLSKLGAVERENLYRLPGSYRGLSETEINAARLAEGIDWAQWQKPRF